MKPARISLIAIAAFSLLTWHSLPASAQVKPKKSGRAPHATRGRVTSVSAGGFDIQVGGKKAPSPVTMHVSVDDKSKFFTVGRGATADLKANDLVAVVGERGTDPANVQAAGILRLWEVAGDPTPQDRETATAVIAGARSLLTPASRAPAAHSPTTGTGSQPPTPPTPAPATARRPRARAVIGKILSTSPLKVTVNGKEVALQDAGLVVGLTSAIALKDLRAGDRVSVVGPVTAGADAAQPSSVTASVVVKAAAKAKAKTKKPKAPKAARLPK